MFDQSEALRDYEALTSDFGLPNENGDGSYYILQLMFVGRRRMQYYMAEIDSNKVSAEDLPEGWDSGLVFTFEEICSDFSALEIARMLKQLEKSNGEITIEGGGRKNKYSPELVEILKQSLNEALEQRVKKGKDMMILDKGYGGGFTGRAFIIECPGVDGTQKGTSFSKEELDAIISYETKAKEAWEKTQGNKEEYGRTRLTELGKLSNEILAMLPKDWKVSHKQDFAIGFLRGAGYLDYRGEGWLEGFDDKTQLEKRREFRNWIRAVE